MLLLLRELALVKVWTLGLVSKHCDTVYAHFYHLIPCCFYIFRLQKSISTIHIALVSPYLRQTSAPIQFTIVFGVLGTQETLCYLVVGLFDRDHLHPTPPTDWYTLGHPLEGNLLLSYKTSALGGPTTTTRRRLCSRHQPAARHCDQSTQGGRDNASTCATWLHEL